MIQWTTNELKKLADGMVSNMRANPGMSIYKACREAQEVLDENRKRHVTGKNMMPKWLVAEVKRQLNTTTERSTAPAADAAAQKLEVALSKENLLCAALIEFIDERIALQLFQSRQDAPVQISIAPAVPLATSKSIEWEPVPKHNPEPEPLKLKPIVLVIGLHPHERTMIEAQLGAALRIKFWNGEMAGLGEKAAAAERIYVLGNTAIDGNPAVVSMRRHCASKVKSVPNGKAPDVIALLRADFSETALAT